MPGVAVHWHSRAGARSYKEYRADWAILWEAAPAAEYREWLFTGIREQGLAVAFA